MRFSFYLLPGLGDDQAIYIAPVRDALSALGTVTLLPSVPNLRQRPAQAASLDTLLDILEGAMGNADVDGTQTILVGYSIGGTLAYALATRLAAAGRAPALVLLLDSSAVYPPAKPALLKDLRTQVRRGPGAALVVSPMLVMLRIRLLTLPRLWIAFIGLLTSRPPSEALKFPLLVRYWIVANSAAVLHRYDGRVVLLKATKARPRIPDPTLGWSDYVCNLEVRPIAGDHWSMLNNPDLPTQIHAVIDTVRAAPQTPAIAFARA